MKRVVALLSFVVTAVVRKLSRPLASRTQVHSITLIGRTVSVTVHGTKISVDIEPEKTAEAREILAKNKKTGKTAN